MEGRVASAFAVAICLLVYPSQSESVECDPVKFSKGIRYAPHPTECDKYIQCISGEMGRIRGKEMICPVGLYWNQLALNCDRPKNAMCPTDPCAGRMNRDALRVEGYCSTYILCASELSEFYCCQSGHSYNTTQKRCIGDYKCTDECHLNLGEKNVKIQLNAAQSTCSEYQPDPEDKWYYYRTVQYLGRLRMRCGGGTAFSPQTCQCTDIDPTHVIKQVCNPGVSIQFDTTKPYDKSISNYLVYNPDHISISEGFAEFDGTKRLTLPAFKTRYWGSKITIALSIRPGKGGPKTQTLLSNSDGNKLQTGSIFLTYTDGAEKPIMLGIETDYDYGHKILQVKAKKDSWIDIVIILDDGNLTLDTGTDTQTVTDVRGNIMRTEYALSIGAGGTANDGFIGLLDYFEIYECNPTL